MPANEKPSDGGRRSRLNGARSRADHEHAMALVDHGARTHVCLALSVEPGSNPPMPTQHLDSEIRALIDQFTSKFRELLGVAALGSVQMALQEGGGTPVRRGPGRPRGSGTAKRGPGRPPAVKSASGRRVRRSSADVEEVAEQVLGYVRAYPGSRLEEIGRGLGTDTAGLKLPVKELMGSGRLRTEGQKRGTKYFAGGSGGKKAGRRGKAKASRKARKAPTQKTGKRGKRKAVRQVAIKPAKARRSSRQQKVTAKTLSAVAESAAVT